MAAKRHWGDSEDDSDQPGDRKHWGGSEDDSDQPGDKRTRRPPLVLSKVIQEAFMRKRLQDIFSSMEPLFRNVVKEEVELLLKNLLQPQRYQIEPTESSSMELLFKNPQLQPVFTGTKILSTDNSPLQLHVVDTRCDGAASPFLLTLPFLKVELVVLEGDFAAGDGEDWSSQEFERKIVKQREGKRPLLVGDVNVVLRNGVADISDLSFTDNSSWGKSGKFKIGARVVAGSYDGPRIKEALSKPFKVKDHRGEGYKKHYPPALSDEVWRLDKIGKDGKFHTRLAAAKINTVQDFLKLLFIDENSLRKILDRGMSDSTWKATTGHAKTCVVGDKLYLFRGEQFNLIVDSVCRVVCVFTQTTNLIQDDLVCHRQLARQVYDNWDRLEEYDYRSLNTTIIPLQQDGTDGQMEHEPIDPLTSVFGEDCFDPSQSY